MCTLRSVGFLCLVAVVCVVATRGAHAGPARRLDFEVLPLGFSGGSSPAAGDYVFRDEESWCAFWEEANGGLFPLPPAPPPVCPEIDFRHETVIASVAAPYPTSCAGIRIDAIERLRGRAVEVGVTHTELISGGGCGCLTVLTVPRVAVVVSGPIGAVEFVHDYVQTGCGLIPIEP